jgi:hypothetical protein
LPGAESFAVLADKLDRAAISRRTPEDLQFAAPSAVEIEVFCLEADQLCSFVERRENKRWIWLVLERRTRQIVALHIGDRSSDSAATIWAKVPLIIKTQALSFD